MARMTKKLIKAIWDSTSKCYTRALKEQYPDVFDDVTEEELDREDFDGDMRDILFGEDGKPSRSPEIHEKYLKQIKQRLSDKELALVIEAHEKRKIPRDGTTIHACMDELFERSVESETRRKHERSNKVSKSHVRSKHSVPSRKRRLHPSRKK